MNLNQPQLAEAARVLSVLIQEYETTGGSQAEKQRADDVQRGLILALADVTHAQRGVQPIRELIKLFVKTYNAGQFHYSVVTAPHPFSFDETSNIEHFADLEAALTHLGHVVNAHSIGWVALLDTQEYRVVGEIYL